MQPAKRRALLLVNRKARSGEGDIEEALEILREAGIDLVEVTPEGGDSMVGEIAGRADAIDLVIVGGGDGTLNCAAAGLMEAGLPLGILPLGTANDLARTLDIPADLAGAARVIAAGHRRRIDLGEVNGHPFFNVASIGLSAELARRLTSEAKKKWGVLGYALAALKILSAIRPFTVVIRHDGRSERSRTVQVAVGNGRYYGGGMAVEEDARPDDGRFNVYSLEVRTWWHLVALAPRLRRGTLKYTRDAKTFDTSELTLETRRPRDVNADGELVTKTPARFVVRRGAIEVFVPEEQPAP